MENLNPYTRQHYSTLQFFLMALHQNSAFSYRVIRLGGHWVYISIVENTNSVDRLQGMDKTVAKVSCTKPPIPLMLRRSP